MKTNAFLSKSLACLMLLVSCKKEKTDLNLPVVNALKASSTSIRFVAMTSPYAVKLRVNGFSYNLTPGLSLNSGTGLVQFTPVPFTLSSKLLDANGNAHVQILVGESPYFRIIDTVIKNDPTHPVDYYIYAACHALGSGACFNITPAVRFIGIPRSAISSAAPDRIKIRLINMGYKQDSIGLIGGSMSLTYANGDTVSSLTQKLGFDSVGAYADIPYGAYRFKVFNDKLEQIPEENALLQSADLGTGILFYPSNNQEASAQQVFSFVRTFDPGGIYTIAVNYNYAFSYPQPGGNSQAFGLNSFSVIKDNSAPPNVTFGKIQFANALSGKVASLTIGNTPVSTGLPFSQYSDYSSFIIGSHHLTVTDNAGMVVTADIMLYPSDYLTVFAYTVNGGEKLGVFNTDMTMSGIISPYDFTGQAKQYRFLNLADDIPLSTFTEDYSLFGYTVFGAGPQFIIPNYADTLSAARATQNMPQGYVATHLPYSYQDIFGFDLYFGFSQDTIRAFESSLNAVATIPGVLLGGVQPVTPNNFLANPSLFTGSFYGGLPPYGEPGIFTIALVGKKSSTGTDQAKLMVIKHIK